MKILRLSINNFMFFAFNLFFLIIGTAYIGIGSWLIDSLKSKPSIELIYDNYTSMGGIMITVGCLCIIVSFVGLLLLISRKIFTIIFYLIAIIFIFLFGISVGIVGFGYAATANNKLNDYMNRNLFLQVNSVDLVNKIQQTYQCCGLNNSTDWTSWINKPSLPKSCCVYNNLSCTSSQFFSNGCFNAVSNSIMIDMSICGAISIAIALPLIFGMISIITLMLENIEINGVSKYQITN